MRADQARRVESHQECELSGEELLVERALLPHLRDQRPPGRLAIGHPNHDRLGSPAQNVAGEISGVGEKHGGHLRSPVCRKRTKYLNI